VPAEFVFYRDKAVKIALTLLSPAFALEIELFFRRPRGREVMTGSK
jgi:hypothetical protein